MSRSLFNAYRVLAFVVGVLLAFCAFVGAAAEVPRHRGQRRSSTFGETRQHLWVAHGWLFMVYVVVAFLLSRGPLALAFTLLVLVAGLIPLLIFWVEHEVTRRMRAEHPELVASPTPGESP